MGINHTLEQRADGQFLSLKQRDFYERTYGVLIGREYDTIELSGASGKLICVVPGVIRLDEGTGDFYGINNSSFGRLRDYETEEVVFLLEYIKTCCLIPHDKQIDFVLFYDLRNLEVQLVEDGRIIIPDTRVVRAAEVSA